MKIIEKKTQKMLLDPDFKILPLEHLADIPVAHLATSSGAPSSVPRL
jgi:hypothetical protein